MSTHLQICLALVDKIWQRLSLLSLSSSPPSLMRNRKPCQLISNKTITETGNVCYVFTNFPFQNLYHLSFCQKHCVFVYHFFKFSQTRFQEKHNFYKCLKVGNIQQLKSPTITSECWIVPTGHWMFFICWSCLRRVRNAPSVTLLHYTPPPSSC